MKLIVIGAGKVGKTLVKNLVKEGHDVVVVDNNEQTVNEMINKSDVNGAIGSCLDRNVLLNAGVTETEVVIACTSHDETNILCCVLAKKLGANKVIARVRDPEYFSEMENMQQDLGIDYFFNPERRTALEIAQVLKFPSAKNVESFADGKATMVEFEIVKGNPLVKKELKEIISEYGNKVLFATIRRGDKSYIPHGAFVMQEGDSVHLIGAENEIVSFFKKLRIFKHRAKTVFVIGGGKVSYYLAKELANEGVAVKLAEIDANKAQKLSELLPKANVLCLDGTKVDELEEEGLSGHDACVTLTGMDEQNVVISLYAKQAEVSKVITQIDSNSVYDMVKMFGLDTVVSPRNVISNHIIRYVRAHQVRKQDGVNTLYKLNEKVEALEFSVNSSFNGVGIKLRELRIKDDILVGGIVREGEFILPDGNSELKVGDKVIIVSLITNISELGEILK